MRGRAGPWLMALLFTGIAVALAWLIRSAGDRPTEPFVGASGPQATRRDIEKQNPPTPARPQSHDRGRTEVAPVSTSPAEDRADSEANRTATIEGVLRTLSGVVIPAIELSVSCESDDFLRALHESDVASLQGLGLSGRIAQAALAKKLALPLRTDDDGRFKIEGLPAGEYRVAVQEDWLRAPDGRAAAATVIVEPGDHAEISLFAAVVPCRVWGRLAINGVAAHGELVIIEQEGSERTRQITTGLDGSFEALVPSGLCHVKVGANAQNTTRVSSIELRPGEERFLDLSLSTGVVEGDVFWDDGRKIAQASANLWTGDSPTQLGANTDEDGHFRFNDVPKGLYSLTVKVDGRHLWGRRDFIEVADAPAPSLQIKMPSAVPVSGTLALIPPGTADDAAIDLLFMPEGLPGTTESVRTKPGGVTFTVPSLIPGRYRVTPSIDRRGLFGATFVLEVPRDGLRDVIIPVRWSEPVPKTVTFAGRVSAPPEGPSVVGIESWPGRNDGSHGCKLKLTPPVFAFDTKVVPGEYSVEFVTITSVKYKRANITVPEAGLTGIVLRPELE